MQKLLIPLLAAALLAVSGCSGLKFPGVYRISVQQGNIIDQEMVDQLELGMTRRQVRFVMGTPLIEDTFNPERWDYYYSLRKGSGELVKKHMQLSFEGDTLASIDGDLEPVVPAMTPEEVREEVEQSDANMPVEPFEELPGQQ